MLLEVTMLMRALSLDRDASDEQLDEEYLNHSEFKRKKS
jgi:hypothetical protein